MFSDSLAHGIGLPPSEYRRVRISVTVETAVRDGLDRFRSSVPHTLDQQARPTGVPQTSTANLLGAVACVAVG